MKLTQQYAWMVLVLVMIAGVAAPVAAGGNRETPASQSGSDSASDQAPDPQPGTTSTRDGAAEPQSPEVPESTVLPQTRPIDSPAWLIFFHEFEESIGDEITVTIDRGYVPTGIEMNADGSVTALYVYSPLTTPETWFLEEYTDATSLNADITARIASGLVPLGFSVSGDSFFVMYGATNNPNITGWRIHQSSVDEVAMGETITLYQQQGFALVDISIQEPDAIMWYLFIRQPGAVAGPGTPIFANVYPNSGGIVAGVLSDYEAGRGIPFAIGSGLVASVVMYVPLTE